MKQLRIVIPLLTLVALFFIFTGQQKQVDAQYTGANYVHLDSTDSGIMYAHLERNGVVRFDTTTWRGVSIINNDGDIVWVCRVDSLTANVSKDSLKWQIDTMTRDGRILETVYINMSNTGSSAISSTAIAAGNVWVPDNSDAAASGSTSGNEVYWADMSAQYSPCLGFKHTFTTKDDDGTDGALRVYLYPIVVK